MTIVHKAIEHDPAQRYASAAELAADLERFIDDEPIQARRVGIGERAWRWCKRNRAIASLALSVQIALLVVVAVAIWSSWRISRALQEKEVQRVKAEENARDALASRSAAVGETYRALVNEARALRLGRPSGWRETAEQNLRRLTVMDTPQRDVTELRAEAAACLGELDLRQVGLLQKPAPGMLRMWSVEFSPDGKRLASADFRSGLSLWDLDTGQVIHSVPPPAKLPEPDGSIPAPVPAVRFHPSGSFLAHSTWDRSVELLGLSQAQPPFPRLEGEGQAKYVTFDRKGNLLSVVGRRPGRCV